MDLANSKCIIWTGSTVRGYPQFGVPKYGTRYGHRITWADANNTDPRSKMVLHRCNNKLCINPQHLYLGTHADNTIDALRDGLFTSRKLTEDQAREILASSASSRSLAVQYNISASAIKRLRRGETWQYL